MPRLGLNTFLYASPFTTEQAPKLFAKLKKWGFETVEIPVEALEHIDPAKVKAAAEKAGLKIGSICACIDVNVRFIETMPTGCPIRSISQRCAV